MTPADAAFAQARAFHEQGELDAAERLYVSALSAEATHAASLMHLGILRLQQGRSQEAVDLTEAAAHHDPENAEAHASLGSALHMLSRHEAAVTAFETALALDPQNAESYYGLAMVLHVLRRHEEAIACYERALSIDPDYAEAACGLGAALCATQHNERAIGCFKRALDVDPDYVEAICGIAEAHQALKQHGAAIDEYRRALAIKPDLAQAHCGLGSVLQQAGRHAEALTCLRTAVTIAPDDAGSHLQLGAVLSELGQLTEAGRAFDAAVALDPTSLRAVYALVAFRTMRVGDPVLAALEAIERQPEPRSPAEDVRLHFASGKALTDIGRTEAGFEHLVAGNTVHRQSIVYDEAAMLGMLAHIRASFTAEHVRTNQGAGHRSNLPIFIVGMPRSGSTLVEQILASHPQVFGGGERGDFAAAMRDAGIDTAMASLPERAAQLDHAQLALLGERYVYRMRRAGDAAGAAAADRITDKMPANYLLAGLINLALPEARIIQTRRDPVDTCLSCYSKLFAEDQPFAYDLGELGRYHRACSELMDHWSATLPPDVILDVQYEDLVDDFEPQARRIIAHCGLDWHPACLSFHETERVVRTASAIQVRQPLYRAAVNRLRPGDDALRPLLDALGR